MQTDEAQNGVADGGEHLLGVVAIGRDEGSRLERCLRSLARHGLPVVYVDSGSTDASVTIAEREGASVVRLDMSTPFSAARARNAGAARLHELRPDLDHFRDRLSYRKNIGLCEIKGAIISVVAGLAWNLVFTVVLLYVKL